MENMANTEHLLVLCRGIQAKLRTMRSSEPIDRVMERQVDSWISVLRAGAPPNMRESISNRLPELRARVNARHSSWWMKKQSEKK